MRVTKSALLLLVLLSIPAVVFGGNGGLYVGGQLGLSLSDSVEVDSPSGPFHLVPTVGGIASLQLGYDYADQYPDIAQGRIELELSLRNNPLDTVEFAEGEFEAGGNLTVQSVMLNFFYEYHELAPLLAYYGVGGGVARVLVEDATVSGMSLADDADDVFAYQIGLGLGVEVSPAMTVDVGYRYFAALDTEFEDSRGRNLSLEYRNHALLFGVRYDF